MLIGLKVLTGLKALTGLKGYGQSKENVVISTSVLMFLYFALVV